LFIAVTEWLVAVLGKFWSTLLCFVWPIIEIFLPNAKVEGAPSNTNRLNVNGVFWTFFA
jgi:hypothetical protein